MAITKVKNYNIAPYYDDFDETKNYHRIQFRPGHAVQARELTQLQTAFQSQLDKLGQYTFKDGSRVVSGKTTLNVEYDFIKLTAASFTHSSTTYNTTYQDANLANFVGTTITGTGQSGNQVTATVSQAVTAADNDPNTLYIVYENAGGANKTVEKFIADEVFTSSGGTTYIGKVGASGVTPTGEGSAISIEEGVYFISGTFVYVAAETIILDKYSNTPTYIIGLSVTETYNVDNSTDATLADNAQGTPNYSAPGAHRYKISTALIKESVSDPNATYSNYILLMKINEGIVTVEDSEKFGGTELTARFARRTHEESGNYAVTPYQLDIREHLDDGAGNGGYLLSGVGGDATKLAIGIEPSIAYVQGHRVENLATKYVAIDKPRGFVNENQQQIELPIGNKVGVTIASMTGMPDIDNYKNATLVDGGGNIGTCRIRGVELWNADKWSVYLYDVQMNSGESFSTVTTITQTDSTYQNLSMTLDPVGTIYSPGDKGLVFQLPYTVIKSLLASDPIDKPEYVVRKRVQGQVTGTGNSAYVTFQSFSGTVNSTSDILIAVGGNAPVKVPVSCVTTSSSTLTITNTGGDLNSTGFHTGTPRVQIIFSVKRNSGNSLQATKTRITAAAADFTYSASTGYILLGKSDIIKINTVTIASVDKSSAFTLDNGQRDGFYTQGRLYPIGSLANGTVVNISFDHYSHSPGDYFSVDSYPTADYATIPQFNSTQGTLDLRDCIDFRPTKGVSPSSPSEAFISGDGEQLSACPQPDSDLVVDVAHYLPRIDKLYIKRNGDFDVISGVADQRPKQPSDPDNAMVIYELHFAPYVFGPSDLAAIKIDNKRYTMRDIGSLDKRIKTLEYYTSLSLLEQQASDTQIFDGANSRLKNGFIVDGFYGHNVGNIIHNDYHVSIDKSRGLLRPKFYEDDVNLVRFTSDAGTVVKNASLLTLPFTHSEHIKQPYATTSEFVNPYNVFSWDGQLKLSPASDNWKDTEVRPDVTIDNEGIYDQLVQQAEDSGVIGTVWGEWATNWSGVDISITGSVGLGQSGNLQFDFGPNFMWNQRTVSTTATATTTTRNQSRDGLVTTVVPSTELKQLGSKVIETNIIPFIRSREIFFKGELMKPNTKLYAFFNGSDDTDFCSETGGYLEWSDQTDVISYKDATVHAANTDLVTNGAGKVEGSFRIPSNSITKFKTGTREFRLTDSTTNDKNAETTSSEALYHAQGLLEVMQNVIISTKVPQFVTSEISENRAITEDRMRRDGRTRWVDPVAQTFLIEQEGGLFVTKLDIFIATKDAEVPLNVSIRSVENGIPTQRIVPGSDVNIYPGVDLDAVGDGLGNNIQVSEDGSVATTVTFDYPVYLGQDQEYAIVLMANSDDYKIFIAETGGFDLADTSNRVTKQPYNGVFFTSANSSTWTPEQMKDLKFTLYRANFSANSGTVTLVNDAIPARKLRADPFRFVRNVGGDAVIRVTHKNHGMHGANAKVTISGYVDAHNGLAASAVNATHTISEQELDSYTITIDSDEATTTAIDGGGTVIYATEDKQYNLIEPKIQTLEVPGTYITYSLEAQSGKSIDGTESGYVKQTVGGILANTSNQFSAPLVVASTINETTYTGDSSAGNKSLVLTCTFNGSSYLSPVIDADRCSATMVVNRLNNATSAIYNDSDNGRSYVADTVPIGASNLNSYLTKRIDLNDEADVLDVYLNVNRPKDSNIDLYYKHVSSGSDVDFDTEVNWVIATPDSAIPTNDGGVYFEAHYAIDPVAYESPNPNVKFGSFAFKIVLRSTNSSNVPTVRDFRAVAAT